MDKTPEETNLSEAIGTLVSAIAEMLSAQIRGLEEETDRKLNEFLAKVSTVLMNKAADPAPKKKKTEKLSEEERKDCALISRKEAAQLLGVCTHTVARHKELHPILINSRLVRYRLSDVQALIKSSEVGW